MRTIPLLAAAWIAASPALAQNPTEPKKWKDAGELAFTNANGNTKSMTFGASNLFTYQWTRAGLELSGGALGARSNGVVTAEQYNAAEKVSWKWSDRDYVFERYGWDKNRFAGILNRHDFTAGVGRELLKLENDLWIAEIGTGYTVEERRPPPRVDFASGRLFSRYTRTISATASLQQDVEYIRNFEDGADYRLNTITALIASITTHVSLKTSFTWKRVNRPPAGFIKDDTITAVAVLVNY